MSTNLQTTQSPVADASAIGTPITLGSLDDPQCRGLAPASHWRLSHGTLLELDAIDANIRMAHRVAHTVRFD